MGSRDRSHTIGGGVESRNASARRAQLRAAAANSAQFFLQRICDYTMAEGATCEDCVPSVEGQTLQSKVPSSKPQDPLDASTFVPPSPLPSPSVTIEFCDRVRTHRVAEYDTGKTHPLYRTTHLYSVGGKSFRLIQSGHRRTLIRAFY